MFCAIVFLLFFIFLFRGNGHFQGNEWERHPQAFPFFLSHGMTIGSSAIRRALKSVSRSGVELSTLYVAFQCTAYCHVSLPTVCHVDSRIIEWCVKLSCAPCFPCVDIQLTLRMRPKGHEIDHRIPYSHQCFIIDVSRPTCYCEVHRQLLKSCSLRICWRCHANTWHYRAYIVSTLITERKVLLISQRNSK